MLRTSLVGLVLLRSLSAHAGACPGEHLVVLPGDDGASETDPSAPTNIELRVVFGALDVEVVELADRTTRRIVASGTANARESSLVLRTATGTEVPIVLRRALSAAHPVWLARPKSELAPRTRYVVSIRTPEREYVVAHFVTTERDADAPALASVTSAKVFRWPAVQHWKDPAGMYAELALAGLRDAAGVELHELAEGETPSETTLRWIGGPQRIRFGSTSSCGHPSYDLPTKSTRTVWLRAFDLAGNTSALVKATLDTRHPARAR